MSCTLVFVFCNFRYENELLVQYNIQCAEDQLATYVITDLDIQGRDCVAPDGTSV